MGDQAAEGLAYIHMENVIHCDVSIGNLLLDINLSIKLCDFQGRFLHLSGHVALDGGAAESAMSSMPRPNRNYQDRKTDIFAYGGRSSLTEACIAALKLLEGALN
jgi:serine/threonine protein kinase